MSKSRDEIIAKIKKLFALSKSSNAHEAASALRMAQKMMAAHQVVEQDVEDDAITEVHAEYKRWKVNIYRAKLINLIGRSFAVSVLLRTYDTQTSKNVSVIFVGSQLNAEMAKYAYEVLLKQLERDRLVHIKRVKKAANRETRGDAFGAGWVEGVQDLVEAFSGVDRTVDIQAYIARMHPKVAKQNVQARKTGALKYGDAQQGVEAGAKAQLHRPVAGSSAEPARALEHWS